MKRYKTAGNFLANSKLANFVKPYPIGQLEMTLKRRERKDISSETNLYNGITYEKYLLIEAIKRMGGLGV